MSQLEYNSVILTVDHTTDIAPHVVQKVVFSTEEVEETVVALLKYYGEAELLTSVETIRQFQELAKASLPGIAYRTPENIQIVLDVETFGALVDRSDTLLDCHQFILDTVGETLSAIEKASGQLIPLTVFDWVSAEDVDQVHVQDASEEQ